MTTLDTPLAKSVVGPKGAKSFEKAFGMATVGDLLRHYPRRYAERGELTDIASLVVGEEVTILAEVERSAFRRMQDRDAFVVDATVKDGSGKTLALTFFAKKQYQAEWRADQLRRVFGAVRQLARTLALARTSSPGSIRGRAGTSTSSPFRT